MIIQDKMETSEVLTGMPTDWFKDNSTLVEEPYSSKDDIKRYEFNIVTTQYSYEGNRHNITKEDRLILPTEVLIIENTEGCKPGFKTITVRINHILTGWKAEYESYKVYLLAFDRYSRQLLDGDAFDCDLSERKIKTKDDKFVTLDFTMGREVKTKDYKSSHRIMTITCPVDYDGFAFAMVSADSKTDDILSCYDYLLTIDDYSFAAEFAKTESNKAFFLTPSGN